MSFDHMVGATKQRERHGDAEGFGGLEIDNQLNRGGLLRYYGANATSDAPSVFLAEVTL
jgi:hypothetical protein